MKLPVIIVNCKTYEVGNKVIRLAEICEKVAKSTNTNIIVAVDAADIYHVRMAVQIPVFAQHVDSFEPGAHTGAIIPEAVKKAGAAGTILNHSEKKLDFAELKKAVSRAKQAKLITLICAATPEEAKKVSQLKPDLIAIEPPELIGGNISVSKAKPEVVTATTKSIKNIPVLCGAGIKTKTDVSKSIELGVKGILVASGITKAKNPEKVLKEFALAMI